MKFEANGFELECDHVQTEFPHQLTFFEIECETEQPEEFKMLAEKRLKELTIEFEYSKSSKLGRAIRGF